MKLKEIFKRDVRREIPPVVFFHDLDKSRISSEVEEYIITGGWPKGHPNATRVSSGIHEQYLRLLKNISDSIDKKETLPASWISGFYGSGKSLFSKMLGLALDGVELPDGRKLEEVWLARNTSPLRQEMVDAWNALRTKVDSMSVIFDIGGSAIDNEQVSTAVLRHIQLKLGYCREFPIVATYELRLERAGQWEEFQELSKAEYGSQWSMLNTEFDADEKFSYLIHKLKPREYPDPYSWIDSWGGKNLREESANSIVKQIKDIMTFRAPQKHLFVVIDEVSQYIHNNQERMLSLQSFVSALGSELRGRVWLLVTGQEKLENQSTNHVLGKLKDRFPENLRVHLSPANIRDVVHKRLLEKNNASKDTLKSLYNEHKHKLALYSYGSDSMTADEFVEFYPLLPGQIDLLMEITTQIRTRSDKAQGDAQAIRGLMQMLGELFRDQRFDLSENDLGVLISIDQFYDLQESSLPSETQNSLSRIFSDYRSKPQMVHRVIKAVALLSMINEQMPTTTKLITQCLYNHISQGDQNDEVQQILNELTEANVLGFSPKHGYSIHSSAAQEWQKEKDRKGVTANQIALAVQDQLKALLQRSTSKPKRLGRPVEHLAKFFDKSIQEERIIDGLTRNNTKFYLDLHYGNPDGLTSTDWIKRTQDGEHNDRLVWVSGSVDSIENIARHFIRSREMFADYNARSDSLSHAQRLCLLNEGSLQESLERDLKEKVENAWISGQLYFKGREIEPTSKGDKFHSIYLGVAEDVLPDIYPKMKNMRIDESELSQILHREDLRGISPKFMVDSNADSLGIFSIVDGEYKPVCEGEIPNQIAAYITSKGGISGANIIDTFERPPYGYWDRMILACVAGLLRAERIYIHDDSSKTDIKDFRAPGSQDVFRIQAFRRATIYDSGDAVITPKDRNMIRKFFKTRLGAKVKDSNGAIADAAERYFPDLSTKWLDLKSLHQQLGLPESKGLPSELVELEETLKTCVQRLRDTEQTVTLIFSNLNVLNEGVIKLNAYSAELTSDAVDAVKAMSKVVNNQATQLQQVGEMNEASEGWLSRLTEQLAEERPWLETHHFTDDVQNLKVYYAQKRKHLLAEQQEHVNETLSTLRARNGFESLTENERDRLITKIQDTRDESTEHALKPSLSDLKSPFLLRLQEANKKANEELDKILSKKSETPIQRISLRTIENQEVENEVELDKVLADLKEKAMSQINSGARVRFTL